ncbi:MAG TPA: glutamate synthase central domain-containing protein, partial [Bacteroidota bacterium]
MNLVGSKHFPLYDPRNEHDACGTGFVANISGEKSHEIIRQGIRSVCNLIHRGAVAADAQTGDGAGLLTQLPTSFFFDHVQGLSAKLSSPDDLGVGMIFMPSNDEDAYALCKALVEHTATHHGLHLLGWRAVPIDRSVIGDEAALSIPRIQQVLIGKPSNMDGSEFERRLYLTRKEIEKHILKTDIRDFYVCSFSSRTIVYKGLMIATALDRFFPDLQEHSFTSAFAVYHQRYSTNTFPTWNLAQPFRMLAHNGEINTIQGNRVWTAAREAELASPYWNEHVKLLKPLIQPGGSDSANLDNALEALTLSGRNVLHSMMMVVPEAWRSRDDISQQVKDFYEYHESFSEPWDGPAALVFSDGIVVGATLDRNGLRPARYKITSTGLVILGSEVGSLEIDDTLVVEKGRLGPGQMIAVDTARGVLLKDLEIKNEIASQKHYSQWVGNIRKIPAAKTVGERTSAELCADDAVRIQLCFGYSADELLTLFKPMIEGGKEPVGSMGDDAPIAVLSKLPMLLPSYFRQQFAQVTNPPIDPLRERMVMSLKSRLGYRRNWFGETGDHAKQVELQSPVLFDSELADLFNLEDPSFQSVRLPALFR